MLGVNYSEFRLTERMRVIHGWVQSPPHWDDDGLRSGGWVRPGTFNSKSPAGAWGWCRDFLRIGALVIVLLSGPPCSG